ncbi:ABC transporter ATP-binding protein [Limimaricola pyoseonensis]|uniref:Carbohydrate ABC transporter ATP-binding protein, CUT1 family n=1 Tax=Limimaricola pyoseonensis TaxID=521013 RepID=A0A1G7L5G7_9RHOB|nr:ABC transporter ATP-binding protein [Limimaricola pyoseonensis]SDF44584.1 carbohydrate ABC transporter ATP-binding protein, CUT1 family [Limimaricola pyoseonensis]
MTALKLDRVCKSFGKVQVLHDIDLAVEEGEFVVFVGPSGCGKSTLLRVIAGLEDATSGRVEIGGAEVTRTPPAKRGIAMVFQSYALYPHLDARGNMALGLRQEGQPKGVIAERIAEAARILSLEPYLDRRPAELSGGQRQRVAIGRAITRQPRLFLFDEPLSNLDAALRMNTRIEIAQLHRTLGASMIYVTHDQTEAMTLADRIVVLRDGRIEQTGSPMELYNDPANRFVAGFLGAPSMNFLRPVSAAPEGAVLGIRPEHLRPEPDGPIRGAIAHVERLGGDTNIVVDTESGEQATIRMFGQHPAKVGEPIAMGFDARHAFHFDAEGRRLRNG